MWMMADLAFFDPSPSPYITTPQATAQYGHVLRVSVVRRSLNSRTSATAAVGENPMSARLDPASVAPVILRNWRRLTSVMRTPRVSLPVLTAREFIPLDSTPTRKSVACALHNSRIVQIQPFIDKSA